METFGCGEEATAADDEASAVTLVSFNESFGEAEATREFERGGLLGDEGVGAAFEQESVATVRANSPAETFGGFEQEDFVRHFRLFGRVLRP